MSKDAGEIWHDYFRRWPSEIERRGVLVTSFGEQIAFEQFAVGEDLLIVERRAPDTLGARTVLVSYQHIQAVKIVDVVRLKAFQPLGFEVPPPRK